MGDLSVSNSLTVTVFQVDENKTLKMKRDSYVQDNAYKTARISIRRNPAGQEIMR